MGLSREQIEDVRKEAEKYKAATGQVCQAMTALWQARVDVAIAMGDDDPTKPPEHGLWDSNTNCPCTKLDPR
jgi:hypothetical protein